MSGLGVRAALLVRGLTPAQKLLLVTLASFDGPGGCWPSVATLAESVGVSSRQVQRLVTELATLSLVKIELNSGGTTRTRSDRRPNRYLIQLDGVTSTSTRQQDHQVPPMSPGDHSERCDIQDPQHPNGVTPMTERGVTHVTRTKN